MSFRAEIWELWPMRHFKTIIFLFAFIGLGMLYGQDGYFIDINYKLGRTSMTNLIGTFLPDPDRTMQPHIGVENGSWTQNNFQAYFGYRNDGIMYRVKLDGLAYGFIRLLGSADQKTGLLKSKIRRYKKLTETFPELVDMAPTSWSESTVHPLSGAGDYKWVDFDLAFGGENLKFGANFAGGFYGANGGSNGNAIYQPVRLWGIKTANMGYIQYGLKAWVFQDDDIPFQASLGIHRVSTSHNSVFTKRHGWGLDLEGKFFFMEQGPYLGGFLELKRISGSEHPNDAAYSIEPNRIIALGLTLGVQIGE